MKKILGILVVLQVLFVPNVYAKELPTISVGSFDAYIGEKIVVPVTIENNPGCSYLGIHIYYDTNSLEYVSSKLKGLSNSDMKDIVNSNDVITLYAMAFTEGKSINDNGVVAEITFTVKENAKTSTLRMEVTDFGGEDLVDYEFNQNDGTIRIADKKDLNTSEDLTQLVPPNTNGEVIWKSKDENIATVDDKGNVTFSNEGNTTITGLDKDGNVVIEKDYTVVDQNKKETEKKQEEKKKEDTKEKEKKQERENSLIYILIALGTILIICLVTILLKHKLKNKKAN